MLKMVSPAALGTYVMVFCAVAQTTNTGYGAYKRSRRTPTVPWNTISNWHSYSADKHHIGPVNAATTIVVFSDYQCPVCVRLDRELRELRAAHGSSMSVVFRHFPLEFHPYARNAALAAECASVQNRFVAYHERLFDHPEMIGRQPWAVIAAAASVPDTAAFSRCLIDPHVSDVVDSDVADGKRLGVFGTPTVLVDDEEYVGIPWDFREIVERHLALAAAPR